MDRVAAAAGDPHTHALFADQSHSIPDNFVALLATNRAWNCSDAKRDFRNTSGFAEREAHLNNVRYLRSFGNRSPQGVLPPVTHNRNRGPRWKAYVQNAEAQALAVTYGMQPITGGVHDR